MSSCFRASQSALDQHGVMRGVTRPAKRVAAMGCASGALSWHSGAHLSSRCSCCSDLVCRSASCSSMKCTIVKTVPGSGFTSPSVATRVMGRNAGSILYERPARVCSEVYIARSLFKAPFRASHASTQEMRVHMRAMLSALLSQDHSGRSLVYYFSLKYNSGNC